MTGRSASAGSARIARIASSPDTPGIMTSSTARSGRSAWQASIAAAPSDTATTSCPSVDSLNSTSSRMSTSSSATRIRANAIPLPIQLVRAQPIRHLPNRYLNRSVVSTGARSGRRLLDLHQELDVVLRLLQPLEQQLEGLLAVEAGEHPAQLPHDGQLLLAEQQLLAAGARLDGVDRREQ